MFGGQSRKSRLGAMREGFSGQVALGVASEGRWRVNSLRPGGDFPSQAGRVDSEPGRLEQQGGRGELRRAPCSGGSSG